MKKLLLLLVLIIFQAFPVQAADKGWYVGYQASAFRPDDDDFKPSISGRDGSDYQFLQGGVVGYSFSRYWAIELEGGTQKFECVVFPTSFQDSYFLLNGIYKYPLNKKLNLYAVAGAGMHFYHDKNIDWYYAHYWGNSVKAESSIALKFGAGTEWKFDDHWAVSLDGSYRYGDTSEGSSFDVYGWSLGTVTVKYYF